MGGDKEGGNEPYPPETDLTLKLGSYQPLGWFRIGNDMARKPGNLNPDSTAGNARLGIGRGSNAGRSQPSGANKAVPAPKPMPRPVQTGGTFQLYQGRHVRVGTFDNIASAKARAQGLIDRFGSKGPDFRVVDPVTGKTIIRIR